MSEYLKYQQFNNKVWEEIATKKRFDEGLMADVFSLPNVGDVYVRFDGMQPYPIYSYITETIVGYFHIDISSIPGKVINRFESIYPIKDNIPESLEFDSSNKDSLEVPELDPCPKCGAKPRFSHPTFDGGSLVECPKCYFHPQVETWARTDYESAIKWNNLCRSLK